MKQDSKLKYTLANYLFKGCNKLNNKDNKDSKWYAEGDLWILSQDSYEPEKNMYFETIMSQANGYMGVRAYTEEKNLNVESIREGYMAGLFAELEGEPKKIVGEYPWSTVEMVSLPEIFSCNISLASEIFSLDCGEIINYNRTMNLKNALLTRSITWKSPKGNISRLEFNRFLSVENCHLAVQKINVIPENWQGEVKISFDFNCEEPTYFRCGDTSIAHFAQRHLHKESIDNDGNVITVETKTNGTNHTLVMSSCINNENVYSDITNDTYIQQSLCQNVSVGGCISVERIIAIVTSKDEVAEDDLKGFVKSMAKNAMVDGFDELLKQSEECWNNYWSAADVVIDGPIRDQVLIRFNIFSLLQMAPFHSDKLSIPARGYAFNRYNGLYYWDSEIFIIPMYYFTVPVAAKNMLTFRHHTLEGAKKVAKRLNGLGAAFPWMTDSDYGLEQAPWEIGDYVWHQTAAVAYAVDFYTKVSGDLKFMYDCGFEMLTGTARFWVSKIEKYSDGSYHLFGTVGPDESHEPGLDNGYTNLMVRHNLRLAISWAKRIQKENPDLYKKFVQDENEISQWEEIYNCLCIPQVPELNIPLQDQYLLNKKDADIIGWNLRDEMSKWKVFKSMVEREEYKIIKQADIIVAMYLLQDDFTLDELKKAYEFYEPMTIHASSLSYNTHSIIATKIGLMDQAYEYFMNAASLDLDNIKNATKDGLHAASFGGTWQSIIMGFAGLTISENGMKFNPTLPKMWNSLKFKLAYCGKNYSVEVFRDENKVSYNMEEII